MCFIEGLHQSTAQSQLRLLGPFSVTARNISFNSFVSKMFQFVCFTNETQETNAYARDENTALFQALAVKGSWEAKRHVRVKRGDKEDGERRGRGVLRGMGKEEK